MSDFSVSNELPPYKDSGAGGDFLRMFLKLVT